MNRKLICLLIAMVMVFTCIPTGLFAEGEDIVTEDSLASLIKNAITESAPVIETVEEPEEAIEEQPEKEIADPVVEEEQEEITVVPEEEQEQAPAEAPVTEEPVEEEQEETTALAAEEVQEEAEVPATDDVGEAFVAGLAYLSAGKVFADKQLTDEIGSVDQEAVVFANARMSGEGDLASDDIIEIIVNIENQLKTLYVKNERLTYLDEVQANDHQTAEHAEGIDYLGTKLDAIVFTSAEMETESETAETPAAIEEIVPEETVENSEVIIVNEKEPVDSEKDKKDVKSIIEMLLSQKSEPASVEPDDANEDSAAETVVNADEEAEIVETAAEPIEDVTEDVPVETVVATDEEEETVETTADPFEDAVIVEEIVETVEVETADAATDEEVEIDIIDEIVEVESAEATTPLTVTVTPEEAEVELNKYAVFTASVENATGTISYKWQLSKDNGNTWADTSLAGYRTDTLTVQAFEARYGWQFRCVVTAENGTEISGSAKLVKPTAFTVEYDGYTITYEILDSNGSVAVRGYTGSASVITIPQIPKEGYIVVRISPDAFAGNTNLKSITLPNTITVIGARAFKGCVNLSTMDTH